MFDANFIVVGGGVSDDYFSTEQEAIADAKHRIDDCLDCGEWSPEVGDVATAKVIARSAAVPDGEYVTYNIVSTESDEAKDEELRILRDRVADLENGLTTLHLQFGEPYYSWQRVLYRVQQLIRRRNACGEACLNAIGYLRGGSVLDESQVIQRLVDAVMPIVNAKDDELPVYELPTANEGGCEQ